ncbi:hypothetical protein HWV62_5322 [Athelia sp. TMB]|nr:hypothetical protein HWV62_5322 [Athelia sp. TMB]
MYTPARSSRRSPGASPHSGGGTPRHRPRTIAELADCARDDGWDPSKGVKHWLKVADGVRRKGKVYVENGDLENGFIHYARAATIVLEKLPAHRDYQTTLNADQRHNLGLNGQEILDSLSELKPTLVDRHERWVARYGNEDVPHPSPGPSSPGSDHHRKRQTSLTQRYDDPHSPAREDNYDRPRRDDMRYHEEQRRLEAIQEDTRRRGAYDYRDDDRHREFLRREEEQRFRVDDEVESARRSLDAMTIAKRATGSGSQDGHSYGTPPHSAGSGSSMMAAEFQRRQEFERQQAEMKRREEEIIRNKRQAEIVRRQQEAEEAAHFARHTPAPSPGYIPPQGSGRSALGPSHIAQFPTQQMPSADVPQIMPLESPKGFEDDYATDRENGPDAPWRPSRTQPPGSTGRQPSRSLSFPPPMTTTSPAPNVPVRYPSLMSGHQLKQGYAPSLQSMFIDGNRGMGGGSLLFVPEGGSSSNLYPSNALPRPSQHTAYPYGLPTPQQHSTSPVYPNYPGPTRNTPIPPPPVPPHPHGPPHQEDTARITRPDKSRVADPVAKELKNVILPRECLHRFLSIAAINTSCNRETCGLLLGKDKGNKYAVTTLLIPRQHSTSDTCTMDEEELVMQFTEERSLITLGWIHTHPSQSCFMSSVDLHTHSGFQRMLPESFAVVCAPKSEPPFGIFRLTDPPGLETILHCQEKEAFHPHPDVPIYTDADKGHIQVREIPIEIVDLRP